MNDKSHIENPNRVVIGISLLAFAFILLVTVILYVIEGGEEYPLFMFIFLAAALGSMVSQSNRSQSPGMDISGRPAYIYPAAYWIWKIFVAIVFSLILYLAFMGEVVSGSLIPQFRFTEEGECSTYKNMINFMSMCLPNRNEDVAKMLVWAFVAGYTEKIIPNLIDKIYSDFK